MNTDSSTQDQDTQQPFSESTWYQALTLAERIASQPTSDDSPASCPDDQLLQATKRLEQWKNQQAFRDSELFAERLQMDAITEQELLMLLAESSEALQKRVLKQANPEWIIELRRLWEASSQAALSGSKPDDRGEAPELLDALKPLVELGSHLLQQGLEALRDANQGLPFELADGQQLFLRNLKPRLQLVASRALVLELNIARLEGRLAGNTPEERFKNFVEQLGQPAPLFTFLSEYPLLARNLLTIIHQWVDYSLEIVQHLAEDWSEIRRLFAPEMDLGSLVEVETGAGDTHRSGRSVAILRFSSGFQLVYKPRSLSLDQHFQELLIWVNTLGIAQPLRPLVILDRESHGWVEFVQARECSTSEEVSRFYARQGSYLALLYALDATDFHYENVLAAGEHPVLVDLEALFHAYLGEDDPAKEGSAAQFIGYSVFRTGLLPSRLQLEKGGTGLDISGLGGQEGQVTPWLLPAWKERGTDQMRLKRERRKLSVSKNRPRLLGQDVEVTEYTTELLKGFTEMYRLLVAHQEAWLTQALPRFERDEVRIVLRPTRAYALLLTESFHPDRLHNAIARERLFDNLWKDVLELPYLRQVIAAERADLLQGDIPLFTTQPGSRDLFTSQKERIVDFCAASGLEGVRERIKAMDESDLARQQWIIRASLATTIMGERHTPRAPLSPFASLATPEQLIQTASSIGDRLEALAIRSGQGVNWLGVGAFAESEDETIWQLQAGSLFLYDGLAGILLFLSYLGKLTGEQRHLKLADRALLALTGQIEKEGTFAAPQGMGIGALAGLGSLIYLFTHLSILRENSAFLQQAQALVEEAEALIEQDKQFDITSGSAGCIMSLLGLYRLAPLPRTLEVAIHCGEHLLANAQKLADGLGWYTLGPKIAGAGLAHGAAGIALSLFQLAEASQQDRFRKAALAALVYERSLFSPEERNWARLLGKGQHNFSVSWCHGAPGIGLARLATLRYHDDAQIRQEVQIALETTLLSFGNNQSLCHGDLGNLETILTATQVLDDPGYHEQLTRLTAQIFNGIQEHGWITGVPLGIETPGLLTGLAGIGYELLRLATPESVPAVLLLAPPPSKLG